MFEYTGITGHGEGLLHACIFSKVIKLKTSLKVGDKVRSGSKTRDPPTRPQKIRAVPPRKVCLTHFAR